MDHIDYEADAVLFFRTNEKARNSPLRVRRFDRTWQAIIFAVESLRPSVFKGCSIEAGERQIFCKEISDIYQSSEFSIMRKNSHSYECVSKLCD